MNPASSVQAANTSSPSLFRDVHHAVLENGLRIFCVESRELPVVSHWIWYSVGSRDEKSGETGLSHFLEHMMFKGTDIYPKGSIDTQTAKLGGNNNAMTSQDYTAYYFNLASDRWAEALTIEASRMRNCLLDPSEFESEKKVVIEELQMGDDDPWKPLWQSVESIAYRVHPYHHPIIGWREDLERLSRDRMMEYYKRHYSPDRAILIVVGDLDAKEAMTRIEDELGVIPASGLPREEVLAEPEQTGERRFRLQFPGNLPRLAMAWHSCTVGERKDTVLDLVSTLLSGGKAARFYKTLIQGRELAASCDSYNETRLDPGLFWVLAEGKPDTDPAQLETAVLEELERLSDEGPNEEELRRCKKQILNSFYFSLETVSSQAHRIGSAEAHCSDGYKILERYPDELRTVTAQEVKDVLRETVREVHANIGWSLPAEAAK